MLDWQESPTRARFRGLIERAVADGLVADKIVSVGLGSVSVHRARWNRVEGWVGASHEMWQFACMFDLANCLSECYTGSENTWGMNERDAEERGEGQRPRIRVYAQDPIFNEMDERFLSEVGVRVLHGFEAWHTIDAKTVLYGIHFPTANAPMRLLFSEAWHANSMLPRQSNSSLLTYEGEMPAVLVINELKRSATEEESAVLRDYEETLFPLPRVCGTYRKESHSQLLEEAFGTTAVYVARKGLERKSEMGVGSSMNGTSRLGVTTDRNPSEGD